jgi:hypothetical protein
MSATTEGLGAIGAAQWTAAVLVGHNGTAMWLLRIEICLERILAVLRRGSIKLFYQFVSYVVVKVFSNSTNYVDEFWQ